MFLFVTFVFCLQGFVHTAFAFKQEARIPEEVFFFCFCFYFLFIFVSFPPLFLCLYRSLFCEEHEQKIFFCVKKNVFVSQIIQNEKPRRGVLINFIQKV